MAPSSPRPPEPEAELVLSPWAMFSDGEHAERSRGVLSIIQLTTWLCSVAWGFLFRVLGHPVAANFCVFYSVFSFPSLYLLYQSKKDLRDPSLFHMVTWPFCILVVAVPLAIMFAFGGQLESGMIGLWASVGVQTTLVFDFRGTLWIPMAALYMISIVAAMGQVEVLDHLGYASLRCTPIAALFQEYYPVETPLEPTTRGIFMVLNSFATAGAIFFFSRLTILQMNQERLRSDELLDRLVPTHIAKELRRGTRPTELTEAHRNVTCFFSDIVGFTDYSSHTSPADVVGMLDHLYEAFDEITRRVDIFKVETIGDAYFAVAGVPKHLPPEEAAYRVCLFAFVVREYMHSCTTVLDNGIGIRIGLHSGDLVTGVLGTAKPRYCLIGDTVNTASRMESTGTANNIHVSSECAALLRPYFELERLDPLEVKGKGELVTFNVVRELSETNRPFELRGSAREIALTVERTQHH
jgi:class 3 adenylate cyclase